MKKSNNKQTKKGESQTVLVAPTKRRLTAAGYNRRLESCQAPRSRSVFKGRRKAKGE